MFTTDMKKTQQISSIASAFIGPISTNETSNERYLNTLQKNFKIHHLDS